VPSFFASTMIWLLQCPCRFFFFFFLCRVISFVFSRDRGPSVPVFLVLPFSSPSIFFLTSSDGVIDALFYGVAIFFSSHARERPVRRLFPPGKNTGLFFSPNPPPIFPWLSPFCMGNDRSRVFVLASLSFVQFTWRVPPPFQSGSHLLFFFPVFSHL